MIWRTRNELRMRLDRSNQFPDSNFNINFRHKIRLRKQKTILSFVFNMICVFTSLLLDGRIIRICRSKFVLTSSNRIQVFVLLKQTSKPPPTLAARPDSVSHLKCHVLKAQNLLLLHQALHGDSKACKNHWQQLASGFQRDSRAVKKNLKRESHSPIAIFEWSVRLFPA